MLRMETCVFDKQNVSGFYEDKLEENARLIDRYNVGRPAKLLELQAGIQGVQTRFHSGRGYAGTYPVLARNAFYSPVLHEAARPRKTVGFRLSFVKTKYHVTMHVPFVTGGYHMCVHQNLSRPPPPPSRPLFKTGCAARTLVVAEGTDKVNVFGRLNTGEEESSNGKTMWTKNKRGYKNMSYAYERVRTRLEKNKNKTSFPG